MLDEYHAVYLKYGLLPAVRRSRGTAFKFRSESLAATLLAYGLTALVAVAVWVQAFYTNALPASP